MKPIFTSYLAKVKHMDLGTYAPIAIFSKPPGEEYLLPFPHFPLLAPPSKLIGSYIRKEIGPAEYEPIYKEMLAGLDVCEVYSQICNLSSGRKPVLICYESPEKFCHRHLVSEWLRNAGFPSEELLLMKDIKKMEERITMVELFPDGDEEC